jgi:hypothetical protein
MTQPLVCRASNGAILSRQRPSDAQATPQIQKAPHVSIEVRRAADAGPNNYHRADKPKRPD